MANQGTLREAVTFFRRQELPGVEIRDVENSSRRWRCFGTGFEFMAPRSWSGDILYRRQQRTLRPGMLFCSHPGEVYTTPRVHRAGSGAALIIDPKTFDGYLVEQGASLQQLDMHRFVDMSGVLSTRLHAVFRLMQGSSTALELQSSMVDLIEAMSREVVEHARMPEARFNSEDATERIRECLHYEAGSVDLERLAAQTGLSRFQVLRAFKRRYGLPPHAYHLRVRIGLAQGLLRAGQPPASVAAEYGFVDQSHFSKHFKRLVGVTPARYARGKHRHASQVPDSVR
jgi:AraC-like DNA-binding protein